MLAGLLDAQSYLQNEYFLKTQNFKISTIDIGYCQVKWVHIIIYIYLVFLMIVFYIIYFLLSGGR